MYVCMYVCMYVYCMYVCILYVCTKPKVFVCMHMHFYVWSVCMIHALALYGKQGRGAQYASKAERDKFLQVRHEYFVCIHSMYVCLMYVCIPITQWYYECMTWMNNFNYTLEHVYVHIHTFIHTFTHTYIHTYTRTSYIHTHIHTRCRLK